jgi:hypothetical protein
MKRKLLWGLCVAEDAQEWSPLASEKMANLLYSGSEESELARLRGGSLPIR